MGDEQISDTSDYGNMLIPASDIESQVDSLSSIAKILNTISDLPNRLRREFRGEMLYEDDDGKTCWVQGQKPVFVEVNPKTGKPVMKKVTMPWGEEKEIYVPNDEAIEEVISILKFAGVNQIQPVGFNKEDNYLDDLKIFECKLAALLMQKQKEWGIDKALLPMTQFKLSTIVQDARALSVKGTLLKSLTQTVQRVEQYIESDQKRKKQVVAPY